MLGKSYRRYQIVSFTAVHENNKNRLLFISGVMILNNFYNPWYPSEIDDKMITSSQKLKDVSTNIYLI